MKQLCTNQFKNPTGICAKTNPPNRISSQRLLLTSVCAQGADGSDIPAGYVTEPVDCDRLQKKGSIQGGG